MTREEVDFISLYGINPNRGQVFAAAYGDSESSHKSRQCSTKEYYTLTDSKRHEKRERKRMSRENMKDIHNTPTPKTAVLSKYLQYVAYILLHLNRKVKPKRSQSAWNRAR